MLLKRDYFLFQPRDDIGSPVPIPAAPGSLQVFREGPAEAGAKQRQRPLQFVPKPLQLLPVSSVHCQAEIGQDAGRIREKSFGQADQGVPIAVNVLECLIDVPVVGRGDLARIPRER